MKHDIEFEEVLQRMRDWRMEVVEEVRSPEKREKALKLKRQIDQALGCLELCERFQIRPDAKVLVMPDTGNGSIGHVGLI